MNNPLNLEKLREANHLFKAESRCFCLLWWCIQIGVGIIIEKGIGDWRWTLVMKPIRKSPSPGFGASFPALESDSKPSKAREVVYLGMSSMGWSMISFLQSVSDSNMAWIFFPIVETPLIHRWGRTTDAFYINPHRILQSHLHHLSNLNLNVILFRWIWYIHFPIN